MAVQYSEIQELLRSRADLNARLSLMPYDGTPEIKERGDGKYLYVRKRAAGKLTSTYVGAYTEELYNLLLRNAREAREIRKSLRSIEKQLAAAGYSEDDLSADVINNIAFARANMKMNIYDQAVLEGGCNILPPDGGDHRERKSIRYDSYRRAENFEFETRMGIYSGP